MLSVTIGIGREMSFQAHNVLAMTVAFHIGRDKDETLALAAFGWQR